MAYIACNQNIFLLFVISFYDILFKVVRITYIPHFNETDILAPNCVGKEDNNIGMHLFTDNNAIYPFLMLISEVPLHHVEHGRRAKIH